MLIYQAAEKLTIFKEQLHPVPDPMSLPARHAVSKVYCTLKSKYIDQFYRGLVLLLDHS